MIDRLPEILGTLAVLILLAVLLAARRRARSPRTLCGGRSGQGWCDHPDCQPHARRWSLRPAARTPG